MKDMEIEIYLNNKLYGEGTKYECKYYEEEEVEDIMEKIIPVLRENIGFVDDRKDKRFVVKFPNVYYEVEVDDNEIGEFDNLFEYFCGMTYDQIKYDMREIDTDKKEMCANTTCGNYYNLKYDFIEEINEDNLAELAIEIYDNMDNLDDLEKHIGTVKILKDLEENYVSYWNDFVDGYGKDEWKVKEK